MNKNLETIINDLKKGLSSPDAETRRRSLLMLSRIDAPEIIEVLLPLKNDPSDEIRRISAKIIGVLSQKYSQAAPLVSKERKYEIRSEIEKSGFDTAILSEYLASGVRETKIAAITAFYGVKDRAALAVFKDKLESEKDVAVVATLVKAIGTIGGPGEIDYLIRFIAHRDNRVKSNAIEALCLIGANFEVFEEVLPLIVDLDERVKITAFQYFSRIDRDVMISEIDRILSGGDGELKTLAIRLTFFYEPDVFIELYEKHFNSLGNDLQSMIIKNLKESVDPRAAEFVGKYDTIGFDADFVDPSFLDDRTGRDIFEIEKNIKKDEEFFFEEAAMHFELGNLERALVELNRATRVNPEFARAWKQKAVIYSQLENYKKALECIDRAIKLAPSDDDAIYNKALILQQAGNDVEAEKCFEATRKLKFTSNVFMPAKDKKVSQEEIKDTIDRLIGEAGTGAEAASAGEAANDAIDRLIDEIVESSTPQQERIAGEEPAAVDPPVSVIAPVTTDGRVPESTANAAAQKEAGPKAGEKNTPVPKDAGPGGGRTEVLTKKGLEQAVLDKTGSSETEAQPYEADGNGAAEKATGPNLAEVREGFSLKTARPVHEKTAVKIPAATSVKEKKTEEPKPSRTQARAVSPSAAKAPPPPQPKTTSQPAGSAPSQLPSSPADAAARKAARKKAPPAPPVEDNFLRNAALAFLAFSVLCFALIGYYYGSSNEALTVVGLARHFQAQGINGELAHLERFAYMDESIQERVDYKGVTFSIRILKVKTPAKAENIRKNKDEGRVWHVNGNFLIAIDRGDSEKILQAFKTFK